MAIKVLLKKLIFGGGGSRLRNIRTGLLRGLRFRVDTTSQTMRLLGLYEAEIARDVSQFGSRAATALDVGSNDGWYTVYFASRPNIKTVLAFEPEETIRALSQENLLQNDGALSSKVTIVPKCVGAREDEGTCMLDTFQPQLQEPILLKIDVEGAELEVLSGARTLLTTKDCLLVVETHSAELERDCLHYLHALGYRTKIQPNGWYRMFVRESRILPFNRWFVAERAGVPSQAPSR